MVEHDFWPTHDDGRFMCCVCNGDMDVEFKPVYCCDGVDCACAGKPVKPYICSMECWEKFSIQYP